MRTLRIEVRARGRLPASDAPLLLIANHVSWLDSYAVNTVSAARFVAKSEVQGWPLIGTIATPSGDARLLRRRCGRARLHCLMMSHRSVLDTARGIW